MKIFNIIFMNDIEKEKLGEIASGKPVLWTAVDSTTSVNQLFLITVMKDDNFVISVVL